MHKLFPFGVYEVFLQDIYAVLGQTTHLKPVEPT